MKLFIDPALAARHPDYRMITVVATGVDNLGTDDDLQRLLSKVSESIRQRPDLADLDDNPRLLAWRRAFEDFGADPAEATPALEALLRRVLAGQEIPFVNKVVAASNIVSLGNLVPSGGDDLTAIEGDFGLRYAQGLEPFVAIGGDEEGHPEPGEVIYADQKKVLCRRWIWRQGAATRITPQSTQVAVNVDVMPPATMAEGLAAAEELADLLERHCGASTETFILGGEAQSLPLPHRTIAMVTRERLEDDSIRRLLDERGDELSESGDMADWSIKDLLHRGNVERIVVEDELVPRLMKGERIKIYQGFDPTSTELHIGHYVGFRTLRWFQLHGHRVIFLIGDATALIGDPTGRSEERQMLTAEQVTENMVSYKEQAGMILEFEDTAENPVEVLRNSDWLFKMDLRAILQLM
ncbi:MAG: tyrosine--tRNA ligase, partial [Thermoanaerobaculia bacterium]